MSRGKKFNTQSGYDLDQKEWTAIGNKKEWEYIGKEYGKSKWKRIPKFPKAEKAEGTRNYVCCEALCYALVVHQGPVNAWFFRRHILSSNNDSDTVCSTQNLIDGLPRMDQSELINAAKEILSKFLNNKNGGKNEFDVETAEIDVEIPNSGVVPSITITHKSQSKSKTYVEIRVRDEIHHNSGTWGFYESDNPDTGKPWMNQLVPLHFKGKEAGVRYDISKLPMEIVGQFKRRFKDRLNVSKVWEDCRDLIHHKEADAAAKKLAEEDAAAANKLAEEEAAAANKLAEEEAAATKKVADAAAAKTKKKRIEIYNRLLEIKTRWIHPAVRINQPSPESLKSLSRGKKFPSKEDKEILNNISDFIYHYNTQIIEWRDGRISFARLKELIRFPKNALSQKARFSVRLIISANSSEETLENLLIVVEPSFAKLKDERDEINRQLREEAAAEIEKKERVLEEIEKFRDEFEKFNQVYDSFFTSNKKSLRHYLGPGGWHIKDLKNNLGRAIVNAEDALKECRQKFPKTGIGTIHRFEDLIRDMNEYFLTTTNFENEREIWGVMKEEVFVLIAPNVKKIRSDNFWLNENKADKKAMLDLTYELVDGVEKERLKLLKLEDQWKSDFARLFAPYSGMSEDNMPDLIDEYFGPLDAPVDLFDGLVREIVAEMDALR